MRHFALPALTAGLLAAAGVHAAEPASVIVTGQRASLAHAIAAQEQADNIVSVVSSDDIGGLPDKNAAEALARMPGVSRCSATRAKAATSWCAAWVPTTTAVTINGALVPSPEADRRAVALDVLPAGLIRSLEVTKTAHAGPGCQFAGRHVEVKTCRPSTCRANCVESARRSATTPTRARTARAPTCCGPSASWTANWAWPPASAGEKRKFGSDNVETGGDWNGKRLAGLRAARLPAHARTPRRRDQSRLPPGCGDELRPARLRQPLLATKKSRDRLTIGDFEGNEDGCARR